MKMKLDRLRDEIDQIDQSILKYLQKRKGVVEQIMLVKREEKRSIFDPEREKDVLESLLQRAEALELNPAFIERLYSLILDEAKR